MVLKELSELVPLMAVSRGLVWVSLRGAEEHVYLVLKLWIHFMTGSLDLPCDRQNVSLLYNTDFLISKTSNPRNRLSITTTVSPSRRNINIFMVCCCIGPIQCSV